MHWLTRAIYVEQNFTAKLHTDFAEPIGKRLDELGTFITSRCIIN